MRQAAAPGGPGELHDVAVRGGMVVDGSGAAGRRADVLISGQTIAAVVEPGQGRARELIDATAKVVCPGFIDSHSHDDQLVLDRASPHPKLTQGVCTVVTGNCGISLAPLVSGRPPAPLDLLGRDAFRFERFADYLRELDAGGAQTHVVPLVGHTTLRVRHVGDLSRPASAGEQQAMAQEVAQALDAGAFGLSTGVYYPPARAATPGELAAVAAPLRGRGAVLACHLRDEGDHIEPALREAIELARTCAARLVLSHHKVVGAANHGRTRDTLHLVEQAAAGQPVCLDCYPYAASSTMLDPDKAARTPHVLIAWSTPHPELAGRSLQAVAQDWGVDTREAALRLMPGGAIYFSMDEADVRRVLAHPLCMVGSDGLPHDTRPHPRLWGSFARVLGHYVRDVGLLSLEQAIRKMTSLPASRYGLAGRGRLLAGFFADLVVLDPRRVGDAATYESPCVAASGIEAVLVNGRLSVWQGRTLAGRHGQRLRPGQSGLPS